MKKAYLSFPIEERTRENILKTIEIMTNKAKELWGDDITVVPSYFNQDDLKSEEYLDYMTDTLKNRWPQLARYERLVQCDYIITFENIFQNPVCQCEKDLASSWGIEAYLYPNWAPIKDYEIMLFGED